MTVRYLEEVEVERGRAAGAEARVLGRHGGEQWQRQDAAHAGPHRAHAPRCRQLRHAQVPDRVRVHLLVLPTEQ